MPPEGVAFLFTISIIGGVVFFIYDFDYRRDRSTLPRRSCPVGAHSWPRRRGHTRRDPDAARGPARRAAAGAPGDRRPERADRLHRAVARKEEPLVSGPEAVVAFMFFGGTFWVLRPIGAALAKRISGEHRKGALDPAERD